jgi:tRNA-Thr(GGU) m(6)t(6)A37 methyltransferase TsaA
MTSEITVKPVGVIHSPYKEPEGMPIQSRLEENVRATAEIFPEYRDGLQDLEGFSNAYLIFYMDRAKEETLVGRPFLENVEHGIFAIRSPKRPNHIGLSIVRIEEIKNGVITFSGVDMLDNTPLLDIKPYVSYFDAIEDTRNGWLEKHFENGDLPVPR